MHRYYFGLCLLCLISPSASVEIKQSNDNLGPSESIEERYFEALQDAKEALPSEVAHNLTAITRDNPDLVWDENGRVLMLTWTRSPSYDDFVGQEFTPKWEVWVTAVPELKQFCAVYPATEEVSLSLRLEQLLGLPPFTGKDRMVEMWVNPEDLFRPTPDNEITDTTAELAFPSPEKYSCYEDYKFALEWFHLQLSKQQYDEPKQGYPWTRLGYSYDWGNAETEVGLSEFVVKAKSQVGIRAVTSTENYCGQSLA